VHFACIADAIKALETLTKEEKYANRRMAYGRDRSSYDRKGTEFPPPPPPPTYESMNYNVYSGGSPDSQPYYQPPMPIYAPPPQPLPPSLPDDANRTVYLGGLHPDTTYNELLDIVRGGNVASCKILPEKNCAFITFVEPENAATFHHLAMSGRDIMVHGQKIKVGWGKPNPLPATVVMAISRGATRNVYIGGIDTETVTDKKLEADLSQYGTIEKVNIVPDKNIAFINFTSIQNAVKAVAALRQDPGYIKYKINYGKDRCARI